MAQRITNATLFVAEKKFELVCDTFFSGTSVVGLYSEGDTILTVATSESGDFSLDHTFTAEGFDRYRVRLHDNEGSETVAVIINDGDVAYITKDTAQAYMITASHASNAVTGEVLFNF